MFGRLRSKAKQPVVDRSVALGARPVRAPVQQREEDANGDVRLTMRFPRPGWQRRMGAEAWCTRTFVLDTLGREVYDYCDETRTVESIIEHFARRHQVSRAEAEYSVTTYLRTLLSKGLVAMLVEKTS
jgi:hypothetical protein